MSLIGYASNELDAKADAILALFRAGNDTAAIAKSMKRTEAEIYNLLAVARNRAWMRAA